MASTAAVSILTPTYKRGHFLKLLATMLYAQTHPLGAVEWVIVDDSPERIDWLDRHPLNARLLRIVYRHQAERICIGDKRNLCKAIASGDLVVHMDDDDFYGELYLAKVVAAFAKWPAFDVVGASMIQMVYPDSEFVWTCGPFHRNHTCGATMSYRRRYAERNSFRPGATRAEEKHFLQDYRTPVKQLSHDIQGDYFAVAHTTNTVNKYDVSRRRTDRLWASVVRHTEPLLAYYGLCIPRQLRFVTQAHSLADKAVYARLQRAVCNALMQLAYVAVTALHRQLGLGNRRIAQ